MSSNFQQFNPGQVNQESDAAYTADTQRIGGAPVDSVFPSALANKLFFQLSTMVAALGQFIVAQGFGAQDSNLTTLLANLTSALNALINGDINAALVATKLFDRVLSVNTSTVTITPTLTFQSLMSAASPIPANALNTVGKIIRMRAHGTFNPGGTTGPGNQLQVAFNFGGGFVANCIAMDPGDTNLYDWDIDIIGVVLTTGATGTMRCISNWNAGYSNVSVSSGFQNSGASSPTFTLNLTAALTPAFAALAASSVSITQSLLLVEQLN
jgi:hypothetical protein